MSWFLALQGSPSKGGQSLNYELHESADIDQITQEMADSVTTDRAVAVPAVVGRARPATLYVRPAAWGAWMFYEMSEDERQQLMAARVNAVNQANKQRQGKPQQQGPRVVTLPGTDPNTPNK
jgi:hypothetical protein